MTRRTALTIGVQAVGGVAVAAVALPAVGFAVAPLFEEEAEPWQAVGPTSDFSPDTYRSVVITAVEGIGETGKTTAYVRQGNPAITNSPEAKEKGYPPESPNEYIAISTRCAHLGCPVRFVAGRRATSSAPATAASTTSTASVIGGPPVRPLDRFQTRVTQRARSRSAPASASPHSSSRFAPATRVSSPAESGSTSTRRGPRCRRRRRSPPCRSFRDQDRSAARPSRENGTNGAQRRQWRRAGRSRQGGRRRRRRLAGRAHRRHGLPHRDALPQGPEGHELVLHARARPPSSRSSSRR